MRREKPAVTDDIEQIWQETINFAHPKKSVFFQTMTDGFDTKSKVSVKSKVSRATTAVSKKSDLRSLKLAETLEKEKDRASSARRDLLSNKALSTVKADDQFSAKKSIASVKSKLSKV